MKYLLWALIAFAIVLWIMHAKKAVRQQARKSARPEAPVVAERMVCCAHCGTYVPASESVPFSGVSFCSEEHRRLHSSSHPQA
ncbi:MAG TPA: PP0621 family protein [Noviherbaspirillum sp.]|uniref:PP0621 family protein n=1 Tax=Noviherbaspirillum sp. TaxID=1926288 RepID=UPI002D73B498|nr:PP0621 family protein [Noviherbaspirillum sp.]HYD95646.1 PP0621 family protein [Noviherbaspirillum sp.]